MRVDTVVADAFGPFSSQRLELAPGMTVIYGPNEVGKSSWFAAAYAGLCGIRRVRGRGTVEQRAFKRRHKPWHTRGWRVGVEVTLDDGRRMVVARNLNSGETQVIDLDTEATVPVDDWEYEGSPDGSTLLGLTRDSARATIFVEQADVLRVLESADELQEFLQRAAASSKMDITVEHALAVIADQQRTDVGRAHLTSRPLGGAIKAVEEAEAAADAARDRHDELLRLLVSRQQTSGQLDDADASVARMEGLLRWRDVIALEDRLLRARSIEERLHPLSDLPDPAEGATVRIVTERLSACRDRGDEPTLPQGPSSDELQQQIDALPEMPVGDVEVNATVAAARDRLLSARAEATSHRENFVEDPDPSLVEHDADELRGFAEVLTRPEPEPTTKLEDQLAKARAERQEVSATYESALADWQERRKRYEAARAEHEVALREYDEAAQQHERQRADYERRVAEANEVATAAHAQAATGRMLLLGGGVGLVIAIVLLAVGLVVPGVVVAIIGLIAAVLGVRGALQTKAPPTTPHVGPQPTAPRPPTPPDTHDPGPAPTTPASDPRIAQLEVEFRHREQARAIAQAERRRVADTLRDRGLSDDPVHLRELARQVDGAQDAAERHRSWQARATELDTRASEAAASLQSLLESRVSNPGTDRAIDHLWEQYLQQCRERAAQAQQAGRRSGLQETLEARQQAEARYRQQRQAWEEAERRLLAVAERIHVHHEGSDLTAKVSAWLADQEALRAQREQRRELRARLEQMLEGQTIGGLQAATDAMSVGLGERPAAVPDDVERQLEDARRRRDALLEREAGLGGQLNAFSEDVAHPAQAIEREAQALRQLEDVRALSTALQLAEQHLQAAKERVNSNIAPALTASIRPWLPRVTGERYTDASVSPESLQIEVRGPDGVFRAANVLSHGTMEQAYLLLRIALADHLGTNDERAPMFLDDVTVQSDAARTSALLDLLHDLSAERQIVLFSQEDEVIAWARTRLTQQSERLIELAVPSGQP